MPPIVFLSLAVNVVVLVPVCFGLLTDASWAVAVYGPPSPGRQILLAVYAAILLTSCLLFGWQNLEVAVGLLLVQVIYKLLSPVTVGSLDNPVVISNLVIAGLHLVSLGATAIRLG